jgi:Tol biopolymer transport system component
MSQPRQCTNRRGWSRPVLAAAILIAFSTHGAGQVGSGPGTATGVSPDRPRLRVGTQPSTTIRVNTNAAGVEADGKTDVSTVSADGRFVAYSSVASNIVGGDTLGLRDVFVYDTLTGQADLASGTPGGQPGNGVSGSELALSASGHLVAFDSWASDLVPGDTNGQLDIFVRDLRTGSTERVSVDSAGAEADGPSAGVSMSADGRWITFSSWASNLVPGDVNGVQDVFLHDRQTGETRRISETAEGVGGEGESHSPAISSNGMFVAYSTRANNLVSEPLGTYHYIFVHDLQTESTWHASVDSLGEFAHGDCDTRPSITPDGRYVAFATDAYNLAVPDLNWVSDIFVHDRLTGDTTRVSVSSTGAEANGGSILPTMSDDGRYVAYMSSASNLVAGDTNGQPDVFLLDRNSGKVRCVSLDKLGGPANGPSTTPTLSPNGLRLVFGSDASDLIALDANQLRDVFLCTVP